MMREARLREIERVDGDPLRKKAREDRNEEERLEVAVLSSSLVRCVGELLTEVRRLRPPVGKRPVA